MARKVYRNHINKLKHDKKLLWIVIISLGILNIGQLYYAYKITPSNEAISKYQKQINEDTEKIRILKIQLKRSQGSVEQVSFTKEGVNDGTNR